MIVTTTPTVEGHKIVEYKGIVFGETIIGTNMIKDFIASFHDLIGGRSNEYESVMADARETSLKEMVERAQKLGANAIVGIDVDYETVGASGGLLMVTTSGTAVVIE